MAGEAEALAGMAWTSERTPCRSARWLVTRGEQGAHEHLPDGNVTHLPAVKVQGPSQAGLQAQLPAPAGGRHACCAALADIRRVPGVLPQCLSTVFRGRC